MNAALVQEHWPGERLDPAQHLQAPLLQVMGRQPGRAPALHCRLLTTPSRGLRGAPTPESMLFDNMSNHPYPIQQDCAAPRCGRNQHLNHLGSSSNNVWTTIPVTLAVSTPLRSSERPELKRGAKLHRRRPRRVPPGTGPSCRPAIGEETKRLQRL